MKVTSYLTRRKDRLCHWNWQALISSFCSPGLSGNDRSPGPANFRSRSNDSNFDNSFRLRRFRQAQITATIPANLNQRAVHQRRSDCDRHLDAAIGADMIAHQSDSLFAFGAHAVIVAQHGLRNVGTERGDFGRSRFFLRLQRLERVKISQDILNAQKVYPREAERYINRNYLWTPGLVGLGRRNPARPGPDLKVGLYSAKKSRTNLSKNSRHARIKRGRKAFVRPQPRRQSRRTLAIARELSPLARLVHTLQQEKIRFLVAGMSAAILQGVPATTLDTDLWIDLPPRNYMQILRLCQKLGATILANTVVELADGSMVNFLYRVDGLLGFGSEFRRANHLRWLGTRVAVLGLPRIYQSKKLVGRPKDIAHLPLLKQTMALKRHADART